MFSFSFNEINHILKKQIDESTMRDVLTSKGFEVLSETKTNSDIIVKIDVRNNRSDMLCYMGVAREIALLTGNYCYESNSIDKDFDIISKINLRNKRDEQYDVYVNDDVCDACSVVKIFTRGKFPGIIKEEELNRIDRLLKIAGISSDNFIDNLVNFVGLYFGLDLCVIDSSKIQENKIEITDKNDLALSSNVGKTKDVIAVSSCGHMLAIPCAGNFDVNFDVNKDLADNSSEIVFVLGVYNCSFIRNIHLKNKKQTVSAYINARGGNDYYLEAAMEFLNGIFKISQFQNVKKMPSKKIGLSVKRLNSIIGNEFSDFEVISTLKNHGYGVSNDNGMLSITVPSYRRDIRDEIHLIDEFLRLYGYEKLKPQIPLIPAVHHSSERYKRIITAKKTSVLMGYDECIGDMMVGDNFNEMLLLSRTDSLFADVKIRNPINRNYSLLNTTLLYDTLRHVAQESSNANKSIHLFEVSRVVKKTHSNGILEQYHLAIIMGGIKINKGFGIESDVKYSYYDLMEVLQTLSKAYGFTFRLCENSMPFFKDDERFSVDDENNNVVGFLGLLKDGVKRQFGIETQMNLYYVELNIEELKIHETHNSISTECIARDYNFFNVGKTYLNLFSDIKTKFKVIKDIFVKDIYETSDGVAILISVMYLCSKDEVLKHQRDLLDYVDKFGLRLRE